MERFFLASGPSFSKSANDLTAPPVNLCKVPSIPLANDARLSLDCMKVPAIISPDFPILAPKDKTYLPVLSPKESNN